MQIGQKINKPLKVYVAESDPASRKLTIRQLSNIDSNLNIVGVKDSTELATNLQKEDGSNFVFITSDAKGTRDGTFNNTTFEANRNAVKAWHDVAPDKRHFMTTVLSGAVSGSDNPNQKGVLNEGLVNYAGNDWSQYLRLQKSDSITPKDFFPPIFNWLDSTFGVKAKI